jgi:hypothetical protein
MKISHRGFAPLKHYKPEWSYIFLPSTLLWAMGNFYFSNGNLYFFLLILLEFFSDCNESTNPKLQLVQSDHVFS